MTAFPLTERFLRCRWSTTRKAIHSMQPGEKITRARSEKNNAVTSASRLREAYQDTRKWRVCVFPDSVTVERLK